MFVSFVDAKKRVVGRKCTYIHCLNWRATFSSTSLLGGDLPEKKKRPPPEFKYLDGFYIKQNSCQHEQSHITTNPIGPAVLIARSLSWLSSNLA